MEVFGMNVNNFGEGLLFSEESDILCYEDGCCDCKPQQEEDCESQNKSETLSRVS